MKIWLRYIGFLLLLFVLCNCSCKRNQDKWKPNILWIVAEDISPYLGCYGDPNAVTPNLDRLASDGVIYTNAFANAPVCAPARSTIITGMYPPGLGTQHMRSTNEIPEFVRLFPGYLRDAGYYCTNNAKEDYNLKVRALEWDESSRQAHYLNRKPGQPFFAVFNIGVCHESCLHKWDSNLIHDPARMNIPPYQPDLPEIRHDWAQFYDRITEMDSIAGNLLDELEKSGLADSTIVMFYGDHGGNLARSKRFMFETGLRVPFIVHVPDACKQFAPGPKGSSSDRMISFIDLAPTLLNVAGLKIPEYMQGRPFLGEKKTSFDPTGQSEPLFVYTFRGRMDERYDFCRGTFSKDYHYVVNYMPHRKYAQHLAYLWRAPSMQAWEKAYLSGECNIVQSRFFQSKPPEELYDRYNDPWEINNLAGDPVHSEELKELRNVTKEWQLSIRDAGFIPEGMMKRYASGRTIYDFVQSQDYPIENIMDMAFMAIQGDTNNMDKLKTGLQNENPVIRYWAATGGIILGEKAFGMIPELEKALEDDTPEVRIAAAEALYNLGHTGTALATLGKALHHETPETVLFAINVLQSLDKNARSALKQDLERVKAGNENNYVQRAVDYALETID